MKTIVFGTVIEVGDGCVDIELDSGRLTMHASKELERELATLLHQRVTFRLDIRHADEPAKIVDEKSVERMRDLLTEIEASTGITGIRVSKESETIVITAPGSIEREKEICRMIATEIKALGFEDPAVSERIAALERTVMSCGQLLFWLRKQMRQSLDGLASSKELDEWIDRCGQEPGKKQAST